MNRPVILFAPGAFGGAEQVILTGLKALISIDIDPILIIIKESRAPEHAQLFCSKIDFKCHFEIIETDRPLDLSLKSKIQKILPSENCIIHAHGIKASLYGTLAKRKHDKIIITHHGRTSHTFKVKIYEWIEHQCLKKADQVIAVSNKMRSSLIDLGIKNDKLICIENPLSLTAINYLPKQHKKIELLYFGRLSEEKGLNYFIQALEGFETPINLTILGKGAEEEKLKSQAKSQSIHNIEFKGFQNDITSYLLDCDAVVLPSLREGLPMTLIETVCNGISVIASNVGGIPELVEDNKNGLLFAPGNPDAIKKALENYAKNKENIQAIALEKANGYQKKYSAKTWALAHKEIYSI